MGIMTTFQRKKRPPKIPLSCLLETAEPYALYNPEDEIPVLWFGTLFGAANFGNVIFFGDFQAYDVIWSIFRGQFQSVFIRKYSNRYLQSWVANLIGEYDATGEFSVYTQSKLSEGYDYIAQSIFSSYGYKWSRWLTQMCQLFTPDYDATFNNLHVSRQKTDNRTDTDTRSITQTGSDNGTNTFTKEFGDVTETGNGNDNQTLSDSSNKNTNAQNNIYGFNGAGNPRDSGTGSESSNTNSNGTSTSRYDKTISRRDDNEIHNTNVSHSNTEKRSGSINVKTLISEQTFWSDPIDWANKIMTSTKWGEVVDLICEDIAKATLLSIY